MIGDQRFAGADIFFAGLQLDGHCLGDGVRALDLPIERQAVLLGFREFRFENSDAGLARRDEIAEALGLAEQQVVLLRPDFAVFVQRTEGRLEGAMLGFLARQHRGTFNQCRRRALGLAQDAADLAYDFDEFLANDDQVFKSIKNIEAALARLLIDLGERIQRRGLRFDRRNRRRLDLLETFAGHELTKAAPRILYLFDVVRRRFA